MLLSSYWILFLFLLLKKSQNSTEFEEKVSKFVLMKINPLWWLEWKFSANCHKNPYVREQVWSAHWWNPIFSLIGKNGSF